MRNTFRLNAFSCSTDKVSPFLSDSESSWPPWTDACEQGAFLVLLGYKTLLHEAQSAMRHNQQQCFFLTSNFKLHDGDMSNTVPETLITIQWLNPFHLNSRKHNCAELPAFQGVYIRRCERKTRKRGTGASTQAPTGSWTAAIPGIIN